MKSKILLALLVVAFVCLFAVSVNAAGATENTYGEITPIDGIVAPSVIDSTSKAVIKATDGTYYTVPSYYLLSDNATFTWNLVDGIKTLTGITNASNLKNCVVRMEIPEGITGMSTGRFDSSSTLVAVKMPTTLTGELGSSTFKSCKSLVAVENLENTTITSLSVSNTSNRGGVFPGCTALVSISLPSTITAIGKWSFTDDTALTTVNVPKDAKITYIGEYAFEKAKALKSFYFSSTLATMEQGAFTGCTGLTTLENFENTKLTKLDGSHTAIQSGNGVFSGCSSLTAISLPSTITYVEKWAVASCTNLASLTIPEDAKITYIGKYAFEKSKITEVYLPSTLETLEMGAFSNCYSLATVKNLGNTQLTEIGEYTFQNCPITKIELPSTLQGTIGQYAFGGNYAVQDKLVIPNGVTEIAKCAFAPNQSKSAIKEIVLPAGLTTLGIYAFEKNDNTNVIYIPNTLEAIPQGMFSNWGSNVVIVYTGTEKQLEALIAGANTSANNVFIDAAKNIKSADAYGEIVPANVSGKTIVYGYNPCKAFYNNKHNIVLKEGNTCSGNCDRAGCGLFALIENPTHVEGIKLGFGVDTDGDGEDDEIVETLNYYANMYVLHVCANCSKETAEADEYGSIFSAIGYSAEEDDTTSVSFFTAVNHKALAIYEEIAKTELKYGLVVSGNPTNAPITGFDDEGKIVLAPSTVSVSMTNTDFTKFSIKVTGLPNAQNLNCCAYVVNAEKITYLGHNTTSDKAEIINHAGVIELTK